MGRVLIIDLETDSLDIKTAKIKLFGAYDPVDDKYFIYTWNDNNIVKVVELLKTYDHIITFYGTGYDIPILHNHSIPVDFHHIDLFRIFKYSRKNLIRPQGFKSYSMKNIVLELGLDPIAKYEIDYKLFEKDEWTDEELNLMITYLKKDLNSTAKLWNYLIDKFDRLKKFLPDNEINKYTHIVEVPQILAYKVLCYGAKIPRIVSGREGRVKADMRKYLSRSPRYETKDKVLVFKFRNLYTQTIIQNNMFSGLSCTCCASNEGKYHGKNFFKLIGHYCQNKMGALEMYMNKLGEDALTDPDSKMMYDIIESEILNLIGNIKFFLISGQSLSPELYRFIKQIIMFVKEQFLQDGMRMICYDNNYLFVEIPPGKTVEDAIATKNKIVTFLKGRFAFPIPAFDIDLYDTTDRVYFFAITDKYHNFQKGWGFTAPGKFYYKSDKGNWVLKNTTPELIKDRMERRYKTSGKKAKK